MTYFLGALTVLVVLATVLPLSAISHWIVRDLDFPRLQIAVLAACLLVAQLSLLDSAPLTAAVMVGATLLVLLWQLWWILPYSPLWRCEVQAADRGTDDHSISILTANVLMSNRDAQKLLRLIGDKRPDVVVTLESDKWWEDQLDSLSHDYPSAIRCPLSNMYGMHVYSRLPLVEVSTEFLVEDDKPSMHALVTLRSGASIRAHFIHPAPPSPSENEESSERDAELVIVGRGVAGEDRPVIVAGDLNDVAWSSTTRLFRKLSGLLDPRIGRGMFNTFHARYPFLRWPLDHIFHSDNFSLVSMERLPDIGSDHFALLTTLRLSTSGDHDDNGLEADDEDYSRAAEIVEDGDPDKRRVPEPV